MAMNVSPLTENVINHVFKMTRRDFKKINWHNAELNVRPLLSFEEFTDTVHRIIDNCCDDTGRFAPEFLDFSMRVEITSAYGYVELPKDFKRLYEVMYLSDLYDAVCGAANAAQIEALKLAVMNRIKLTQGAAI